MSGDREAPAELDGSEMTDLALETYEAFAPIYNAFNHANDYENWLGEVLLPELERHGLRHGNLLDVACGTGRAFGPMLRRNWRIVGCDLSSNMLSVAEREAPREVELVAADMRALPNLGDFDLVLCLNDAVNYLLADDELERALTGMQRNLATAGLLLFDCNCRSAFHSAYGTNARRTVKHRGRSWTWTGLGPQTESGSPILAARIEGDEIAEPIISRERYYSPAAVQRAMRAAGLEPLAILGMQELGREITLNRSVDEDRDYKFVCIAGTSPKVAI